MGCLFHLRLQHFFTIGILLFFYFVAVLFTQLWVNIEQNLYSCTLYVLFPWVFFKLPPSAAFFSFTENGATKRSKYYYSQFLCTIIILRYYYYLRCAYSSWSMYTKRYHIVKDNNGYEKPRYKEGKIVSKVPFISRV